MKSRKLNAQERELQENWDLLLKEQMKPALDAKKYGTKKVKRKVPTSSDTLARVRDRIPHKTINAVAPTHEPIERMSNGVLRGVTPEPQMSREEYERREKAAREVKHCVMPLHKGAYILVTDEEMVKQMGKKTA